MVSTLLDEGYGMPVWSHAERTSKMVRGAMAVMSLLPLSIRCANVPAGKKCMSLLVFFKAEFTASQSARVSK